MRTINMSLAIIALIVAIAFVGNTSADPLWGEVNSTVVEGQIVTLYLDEWPDDYMTEDLTDAPPYYDDYYYDWIGKLLNRHGLSIGDTYNATIVMRCSGFERNPDGILGDPYTNTFRNTTPSTAHWSAMYDGSGDFPPIMELEPCASGEPPFIKTLYAGWNLISLPLVPSDNSASTVLSTVSYDAVYSYNATSKQFESADVMDPGTGYFVNATEDCEWEYSGAAYTSTEGVPLKQGLNMAGWLNCSKDVGDALSSISGDYHYVARWNTSAEKFEVYNPTAPDLSEFNDFTTMDRGTGYFISAKQDCALSESC